MIRTWLLFLLFSVASNNAFTLVPDFVSRSSVVRYAGTTTLEPPTKEDTRQAYNEMDDNTNDDNDNDYGDLEYLIDNDFAREMEDPFHM